LNSNTEKKKLLLVFAGPPLSGKSALAKKIKKDYRDSVSALFEMDEIRKEILPNSDHNKADRNVAYQVMHFRADEALRKGKSTIILVATYAPPEHRQAVVELAKKRHAEIYLVQCHVSPEDAVYRFLFERPPNHAGRDLTVTRVRELASEWEFYGGGCIADTTKYGKEDCTTLIQNYLKQDSPLSDPKDWVRAAQEERERKREKNKPILPLQETPIELKISPISRRDARVRLLLYTIIFLGASGLYGAGIVSLWFHLFPQTSAFIAAALFIFAVPPVYVIIKQPFKESHGILQLGKKPRYESIRGINRSNRELCRDYKERTISNAGFLPALDGFPVYFLILPKQKESFDVVVNLPIKDESERYQEALRREAANWTQPFDWDGYKKWRIGEKSAEYFGGEVSTKNLRATNLTNLANDVVVEGAVIEYADYLVAEQSVSLEVPGQLPYMREFFEGCDWWSKNVNLDSVQAASQRYSMMISINVLIKTKDDFLVFQRRSPQVQSAPWGLTSSTAGMVELADVKDRILVHQGIIPQRRRAKDRLGRTSLRNSLFREIREELGLLEGDFKPNPKPFIAAALNLKYGRDLNFYAYLECKLSRDEVSKVFNKGSRARKRNFFYSAGRDRWEVSHLVFMPVQWLRDDSDESVSKRECLLKDARHTHGIVEALRVYEGWGSP
jgi:predicted kinase